MLGNRRKISYAVADELTLINHIHLLLKATREENIELRELLRKNNIDSSQVSWAIDRVNM